QYTIVALLILAAVARLIWGIRRKKSKGGSCCGCSLAETCRDYKRSNSTSSTQHRPSPERCDCHK
ncbi:MAG: FeoB-associated Cys-rich membrane protein, partial [Muribaculaceae bacterium]|nr:FeoB-associated Cys-rich membrane protein [Muribaculaceae bacterium]